MRQRACCRGRQSRLATLSVKSVHLSSRVACTERGARWHDIVDFHQIVCRERNVRGAHILVEVLARFSTRYRNDEGSHPCAPCHRPGDSELSERGILTPRDGLERGAQPEVVFEIGAVKARQPRAYVVGFKFLRL